MSRTKRWLAELAPPIAWRVLRKLRSKPSAAASGVACTGAFASYAEAAASTSTQTYDDDMLVDVVYEKTLAYREVLQRRPLELTPAIARVATALSFVARRDELRVLDFGGAFGTHYSIARALLPTEVVLRWHVVETPGMCRRANDLASDELRFFTDITEAERALGAIDLVYVDGVLQALPDPLATLGRLLAIPARHVCLQRVGTADRRVVTVANIPLSLHEPDVPLPAGIADVVRALPMTYETAAAIEAALARRWKIHARWGGEVAYRDPQLTVRMHGYCCESSGQSRQ